MTEEPVRIQEVLFENSLNAGYTSDDESSDYEEPQDSGRTRSSTRRAQQVNQVGEANKTGKSNAPDKAGSSSTGDNKGRKRKKKGLGGDGSDSDQDDGGNEKSRPRLEPEVNGREEVVCSCPKDVMRCIGILPSLPIISYFQESDDSDSSLNDDLSHTILPTVSRTRHEQAEH